MTIIVAGKLKIKQGSRDSFVNRSQSFVLLARENSECEDFFVSSDPIDPDRVNIFEKWKSRIALKAFRESGPESDIFSLVESFDVGEFEVKVSKD